MDGQKYLHRPHTDLKTIKRQLTGKQVSYGFFEYKDGMLGDIVYLDNKYKIKEFVITEIYSDFDMAGIYWDLFIERGDKKYTCWVGDPDIIKELCNQ